MAKISRRGEVDEENFLESMLGLNQVFPVELGLFEGESAWVEGRLEFVFSHQRARNLCYVSPGRALNVLEQHDFNHWRMTPLFSDGGYYFNLRVSDRRDFDALLFCIRYPLDH